MRRFNPFRSEVEQTWVRHRGSEIAQKRGYSQSIGEAEALCELERLAEGGEPMPWIGKVSRFDTELVGMCGAYKLQTAREAVIGFFPKDWQWHCSSESTPSTKVGPSAKKPGSPSNDRLVVRATGANPEFTSMRWRFESKWMRAKGVKVPINARSETMFTNGLFKYSARDKRCLIIVDGFYEPKGPKGRKREQYLFTFDDSRPFALGGLWTRYKADDDEFEGFVIVTTLPNDQVAPIHSRMPVILDGQEEWESWLEGDQNDVGRLCQPIERPNLHASPTSSSPTNHATN